MNLLHRNPAVAILFTTLVAGTMDLAAAVIQFVSKTGRDPLIVLRYIASGVLGSKAFTQQDWLIPVLGLLIHYIIAFCFTVLYFMFRKQCTNTRHYPLLNGIIYGLVVWAVMNLLVVPQSQAPSQPLTTAEAIPSALILVSCIGIPVSVMANKHYLYQKNKDRYVSTEPE